MNSSTHHSFLDRRALITAAMAVLFGTTPIIAQSGSGSSSSSGTTSGSTYGTGSTRPSGGTSSSATDESRRQSSSSTTPSSSSSTGTTDSSRTYGTGSSTSTTGTTSTDTAGGATTATGRETSTSGKLGWTERRFVNKAADSGATEIGLAKLASERASNPEVKTFAQKLIDDHQKVSEELKSLASQKNVKIDEEDLGSDRAHKRLSKKSGMEFDQEFVEQMVDMHESDVKMFEKAASDAKDPELRAFASKHVDHLREHLRQAQSLRSTIMPTGRMDTSTSTTGATGTGTTGTTSTGTSGSTSSSSSTDSTSGTSSRGDTSGTSGTTPGSSTSSGSGTGTDTTRRDRNP